MKNKKTIALAMAAATVAPMVVPTFAAEKLVPVEIIDVELANGKKEGATQEQISDAYQALQKSKSDLEAFSKATYVAGKDDNGKDIVKNRYTINVNRTASTEKKKGKVDVSVVNNLVDKIDDVKMRVYSFTNIDRVNELPEFITPDEDKTILHTISYNESTFNSTIAKIKEAIKAQKLKYELRLKEVSANGTIGQYELTLKYDAIEGVTLNDIAVIKITDAPVGMGGVNGEVLIPENNDFTGHWAEAEIKDAMLDKWINADSTFRPEASITRAEFVKIVNRAFNIPTSDAMPRMALKDNFEDVDTISWYYKDVVAAVNYGYINGYETTTTTTGEDGKPVTTKVKEFRPNQPITRQEAAKIIAAVLKANIDEKKDLITSFADDSDIAVWADQSVQFLKDNNISSGYKENGKIVFKPLNNITRAEAVVMMVRAINVK